MIANQEYNQTLATWTRTILLAVQYLYSFYFVLDIHECSTSSHSCDVNAVCSNTVGSYTCACKLGYSGNGRTCSGKFNC